MNYFVCDIVGTYNGAESTNRDEQLKQFVKNLEKIIELENLEELIFCFESSDIIEFVIDNAREFSKYIEGTKIKMGIQFSGDKYIEDGIKKELDRSGKLAQTAFLLQDKPVNNVYFADDTLMNQEMIGDLLIRKLEKDHRDKYGDTKKFEPYNKLVQFIPGTDIEEENKIGTTDKGISALNEILDKYIMKLELSKKL